MAEVKVNGKNTFDEKAKVTAINSILKNCTTEQLKVIKEIAETKGAMQKLVDNLPTLRAFL